MKRNLLRRAHFYNNDLGQTINAPLKLPAPKRQFKEGGSFDFLVEHGATRYVIRPSCNFIPGQLDGVQADVLFLAMARLGKEKPDWQRQFFAETVDKVAPKLVIPLHWDNFFVPLYGPVRVYMRRMDDTGLSLHLLAAHCTERGIDHIVQLPLTSMTLFE